MTTSIAVKDRVCGMDVDPNTAAGHTEHKGQKYFFCSSTCKEKFTLNPEQYIGQAAAAQKSDHGCCS